MATKIYIDQGHNPQNPNAGAEGNGYREQDLVYTIGQELSLILQAEGYETRLSRPTPETQLGTSNATALAARVNDANRWGADYFISLHANASEIPTASGSEALVYRLGSTAAALGESILQGLNASTGLPNRGVSPRPNLYVLRRTSMPAVLVELGFITNPEDALLMATAPQLFALGIADGITAFLEGRTLAASVTVNTNSDIDNEYTRFLSANSSEGALKIQAARSNPRLPVSGVVVTITKNFDGDNRIFFEGKTDSGGIIDSILLPAPTDVNTPAVYQLKAMHPQYDTIEGAVRVYNGVKSIQPLEMTIDR